MLSYRPDTVDTATAAAADRLAGSFRDEYVQLIENIVGPGAKQQHISTGVQIPAAASVTAGPSHAVVLVFVDQTTTVGNDPPTDTASSVRVTLDSRLNDGVVTNVYTIHLQAGCAERVGVDPRLRLAAEWHAKDVLGHRDLDGDLGSDGSTPQARAQAAGFPGAVVETVAINPALSINGSEILNRWYYNPTDFAIMSACANTAIGVRSENSPDRSVVVAVYGAASRGAA